MFPQLKKAEKMNTVFAIKFMLILNYQKGRGGEKMIIYDFLNMLLSGGLTIFVIVIILAILIASYKKASPNEVLIITGGCSVLASCHARISARHPRNP